MTMMAEPSVFVAHGEGRQMFGWLDGSVRAPEEAIFEGVAGCGKTRMIGEWVVGACNQYPDSKGIIIRKTRVSLTDSVLPILEEEVLGLDHPAVLGGPSRPHRGSYSHPRLGGEIRLGGMDDPTRLFSTQYDWAWVNECQEFSKDEWESLHRALRRGKMPFALLLGDCNPEDEYHWANRRMDAGKCHRIIGRFWDNPVFYDHEAGEWTARGKDYLKRLSQNLTGVRRARLFEGRWVSASGQVWETYDAAVHLIDGTVEHDDHRIMLHVKGWEEPVELIWFVGGQDIGHTAPGSAQVVGFDADGRAYRVCEVYQTRKDHVWWADVWAEIYEKYPVRAVLCDHDKAFIDHLNSRLRKAGPDGLPGLARPANKMRGSGDERAGIDEVRVRFKAREDGTRGLYLLRNCLLRGRDPDLLGDEKPTCLHEEIPSWVYYTVESGKPIKDEPDPACADHACDAIRYIFRWVGDRVYTRKEIKYPFPRGSINDELGLNQWFRRHGWA